MMRDRCRPAGCGPEGTGQQPGICLQRPRVAAQRGRLLPPLPHGSGRSQPSKGGTLCLLGRWSDNEMKWFLSGPDDLRPSGTSSCSELQKQNCLRLATFLDLLFFNSVPPGTPFFFFYRINNSGRIKEGVIYSSRDSNSLFPRSQIDLRGKRWLIFTIVPSVQIHPQRQKHLSACVTSGEFAKVVQVLKDDGPDKRAESAHVATER